jgi:hypothetical protein
VSLGPKGTAVFVNSIFFFSVGFFVEDLSLCNPKQNNIPRCLVANFFSNPATK